MNEQAPYHQPELILASASPRRHELLQDFGIPFRIQISTVDESSIAIDNPRDFAIKAAEAKCRDVALSAPKSVIIGADTIVCFPDGAPEGAEDVLFKPLDSGDACRMLGILSGRPHTVFTGVAVYFPDGSVEADAGESRVSFRNLSDSQIREYVATREPLDKAGAYGIQDQGKKLIEKVEGDLNNVIGLPMHLLGSILQKAFPKIQIPPEKQFQPE